MFVGNAYWLSLATQAVIFAIIFLSITVFTGMAGEISLAQGSFAAIGAFACGQLATRFGVSVFLGMVVGIAIAVVVGVLLAIPALRLGGIYLALATLAFGLFFENVIVNFDWAGGGLLPVQVPRPELGPIDFTSDRTFFVFCILCLVVASIFVMRVRGGTTGLYLRALAGSEAAASAIAVSATRARITAFALSAGIAAAGGALLSVREGAANYQADFTVQFALFWLVLVVTLGPRTVDGAIEAALALKFFPEILKALGLSPSWQFILFGLGAIAFARHPEGMLEHGKRTVFIRLQRSLDARHPRPAAESAAAADGSMRTPGSEPSVAPATLAGAEQHTGRLA
jgi:ABC-type branched-subunit amino acid transport system permease subunit